MAGASRPHPAWAMWLPGVAAFAGAILLAAVDLVGLVMGSWDSPAPGLGWLKAGAIGQCGVAAAAAAVLVAGAARPGRRRGATVTAWVMIALAVGWFLLTRTLASS